MMHLKRQSVVICFVGLSLALAQPQDAFAGKGAEFFARVAKEIITGVIATVIVDTVTKPARAETVKPPPANAPVAAVDRPSQDEANAAGNFARAHFAIDSKCDVARVLDMYAQSVYYESNIVDKDHVGTVKTRACQRYTPDMKLSIRSGSMYVSYAPQDKRVRIVDYVVDFDVFSIEKQERLQGATSVRLVIQAEGSRQWIIGELHKKLSA